MRFGTHGKYTEEEARAKAESLPKWATDLIDYLDRKVWDLEQQVGRLETERGDGEQEQNPIVTWEYGMEGHHSLDDRVHVRFYPLNDRDKNYRRFIEVFLREMHDGLVLDVNGDAGLLVEPRASNLVHIRLKERG